jgi:hypothetical protein
MNASETVEDVLTRLLAAKFPNARPGTNGWLDASCPGPRHKNGDRSRGLGIKAGDRGVILKCQVGCTLDAILAALGLEARDLFPRNGNGTGRARVIRETVFVVRDVDGTPVAEQVRFDREDGTKATPWRLPGAPKDDWGLKDRVALADLLYGVERLRLPPGATVVVTEGPTACDALTARSIAAVGTMTGASGTPSVGILRALKGFDVVLWPDADFIEPKGRAHMRRIAGRLVGLGVTPRWLDVVPDPPKDGADAADFRGTDDELRALMADAPAWAPDADRTEQASGEQAQADADRPLLILSVDQFLAREIPLRDFLLNDLLRERDLAMVHSWRGVGKTFFNLGLAYAIATGGTFLKWAAPRARRVLYLDGELPARVLQERIAMFVRDRNDFDPENLQLYSFDLQELPLETLADPENQARLDRYLADADVILVDSIATLATPLTGDGKSRSPTDEETWLALQPWAMNLRRRGKTVLFVHHDGKSGEQRGTTRKEDVLDLVLQLKRPKDYEPEQGARFELHFRKNRGLFGPAVEAFEVRLETDTDGRALWTQARLDDIRLARAAQLFRDGATAKVVATELGIGLATAYRLRTRAEEQGLYTPKAKA